jgi:hypothetical protein
MKSLQIWLIGSIFGLLASTAFSQDALVSPHGDLKLACEQCHTSKSWSDPTHFAAYEHRSFPLKAAHAIRDCQSCHASLVFEKVGKNCIDCHQDVHKHS